VAGTRNRLWLKLVPMGGLAVLLFSGLAGNLFGDSVPSIPPEARYKNQQVTMPPEIVAFVIERGNLAESIARQQQLELSPDIIAYFEAVKAGRLGESQVLAAELQKQAKTTNSTSLLKGPVWQVCLDVVLVAEALADSDTDQVLARARDLTNSLVPGCIYFGGTDPGRGLPTMLCTAPGEPFFVLSQNPLADGRYMDLLRREFGGRIWLPDTNEVQQCYTDYMADVQARQAKGRLEPGEDVRMENGKPVVAGQVAVMKINGLIAKIIFDHNPDRDFYVEESFPLDWMYPYLSPHGLLMKVNRVPLQELTADASQQDEAFWNQLLAPKIGDWLGSKTSLADICEYAQKVFARKDLANFKGDPRFLAQKSNYMPYSHWRSAIAGMYAWRLSPQCPASYQPKDAASRKRLTAAADLAFRQTLALCPYSPEAVFQYINFLLQVNRIDDALLVANTALACTPTDDPNFNGSEQLKGLIQQLGNFKKQSDSRLNVGQLEQAFRANLANLANGVALARQYLSSGQTSKADQVLDEIVANPAATGDILGTAAQLYSQQGKLDKLERVLVRMTEATPESPEAWFDLARLRAVLGKKPEAITALKQALALNARRLQANPAARDLAAGLAKDGSFNSLKDEAEFKKLTVPGTH